MHTYIHMDVHILRHIFRHIHTYIHGSRPQVLKRAAPNAPLVRHSQALPLQGVLRQVWPRDILKYHRSLLAILLNTNLALAVTYGGWQFLA